MLSGHTGVDFSQYEPDQHVENVTTEVSHGFMHKYAASTIRKWTVREAMANIGDAEVFNTIQTASPVTFEGFIEHVIPVLQARVSYRTEYETSTLRESV